MPLELRIINTLLILKPRNTHEYAISRHTHEYSKSNTLMGRVPQYGIPRNPKESQGGGAMHQ